MFAYWVNFETCIHAWSVKFKYLYRPQYACQKDVFTWVYENSPCVFLPLTSATAIWPKKRNVALQTAVRTHHKVTISQLNGCAEFFSRIYTTVRHKSKPPLPLTSDTFLELLLLIKFPVVFSLLLTICSPTCCVRMSNNYVVILSWKTKCDLNVQNHSQLVIKNFVNFMSDF